jgi:hypothetical protein
LLLSEYSVYFWNLAEPLPLPNTSLIFTETSYFLAAKPEIPGSIPGAARFSEYQWFWNGVHLAS